MNVNNGINQYNTYINNSVSSKVSNSQSLTGSPASDLKEGQIFEGSVNNIENGRVTIGLANGQTMSARLDSGVTISEGQSLFFQVKSNDGTLVQIKPVSLDNISSNPTLLKALDSAGLVATDKTLTMVDSMMKESMPIDTESLISMNRLILNNPSIDLNTVISLVKYGMDVNTANANTLNAYIEDNAKLSENYTNISQSLNELLASGELSSKEAVDLSNNIQRIFLNESADDFLTTNLVNSDNMSPSDSTIIQNHGIKLDENNILNTGTDKNIPANQEILSSPNIENDSIQLQNNITSESSAEMVQAKVQDLPVFSEKTISQFENLSKELPDFNELTAKIFNADGSIKEDLSLKDIFSSINDYINETSLSKDELGKIFSSRLYKDALSEILSSSLTLKPEELSEENSIKKLYTKILKQTTALENVISNFHNKAADNVKEEINLIKNNVNFMESANEIYNFVQIPLKMYNQNTDGMLYVKQNKKTSYQEGEEITAFLHFDMEHLGSTDVYIKLKSSDVNCNWKLSDSKSMDLIEAHLDILTERLSKKGYSVTSEVECSKEKFDIVSDFFEESSVNKGNVGLVHRYTFDMRA